MVNHQRSIQEYRNHLRQQIDFLQTSAKAYDDGKTHESKRLATTLRTLLHDTKRMRSLLGQMGRKHSMKYVDTIQRSTRLQAGFHYALVFVRLTGEDLSFVPMLYENPDKNSPREFDVWWKEEYVVIDGPSSFTREKVVLLEADKEGGAHLDPEMAEETVLLRSPSLPNQIIFDNTPFRSDVAAPTIRQITFELLLTLRRYYPELFSDVYF